MIHINGKRYPNFIMNEQEICNSLKIGLGYLRVLEDKGLQFMKLDTMHLYEPVKTWQWYLEFTNRER